MISQQEQAEFVRLAEQAIAARRLDTAQVLLDGLCALDAFDRWSVRSRTEVALRRGDAPRALQAADAWIRLCPRDAEAMRARARALLSLGEADEGARWMAEAARRGDHIAAAWVRCQRP